MKALVADLMKISRAKLRQLSRPLRLASNKVQVCRDLRVGEQGKY